jgi:hypothetical protein
VNKGHFAVIVGINRYPGLPTSLNRAKGDAEEFHKWLVDETGGAVPPENVQCVMVDDDAAKTYTDHHCSHPTVDEINTALSRVNVAVRKLVDQEPDLWDKTRLYFYASGHGIAPSAGVGALLSAKSAFNEYESTYDNLEFEAYRDWYRSAGIFHEVLVFADCCRERRPLTPSGGPPFDQVVTGRAPVYWTLGFATELGQLAYEPGGGSDADSMRGYFTHALMDGLRGGAADQETGEITTDTLAEYVMTSVEWQLKGQSFQQAPSIDGTLRPPIVLRPAGVGKLPKMARTVTLCVQSEAPEELVVYRRTEPTEHRFARAAGTVKLELEEDLYQVRDAGGAAVPTLKDEGVFRVIAVDRNVDL